MRRLVLAISICLLGAAALAQQPQFSQIQSVPLHINPALTGMNEGVRYASNYRREWAGIPGGYTTFGASADMNLHHVNSGVGFSFVKDVAGTTKMGYTAASGYYSHRIRLGYKHWMNAGVRVGYLSRSIDLHSIVTADQIARDNALVTLEPNLLEKSSNFDFGFGMAYYKDDLWFGVSVDQLLEPELALLEGGSAKVPLKLSVHGGKVVWSNGNYRGLEQVKVIGQYKRAGQWDQLDIGAYYSVQSIYGGLLYRGIPLKQHEATVANHDAIAAILGLKFDNGLMLGYSYDFTISTLTARSGGSHEIALIFTQRKSYRKKIKIPPCMKF